MDVCFPHTLREGEVALQRAAELYDRTSRKDAAARKRQWASLLFRLREFFQTVEILSRFNFHCTRENLLAKGVIAGHQQPSGQQLCKNFMNGGGNVCFRKKWPLIRREIISPLNRLGAAQRFYKDPNVYECAVHYLASGGLERFWAAHPEFMLREDPELLFEDDAAEEKNAA
jgi:hypothetical protein